LNHHTTPAFWKCYGALPEKIKTIADARFEHLKGDPRYPSLQIRKVGRYWRAPVGLGYRAFAEETEDSYVCHPRRVQRPRDPLIGRYSSSAIIAA
jgi:hypothetical protein